MAPAQKHSVASGCFQDSILRPLRPRSKAFPVQTGSKCTPAPELVLRQTGGSGHGASSPGLDPPFSGNLWVPRSAPMSGEKVTANWPLKALAPRSRGHVNSRAPFRPALLCSSLALLPYH